MQEDVRQSGSTCRRHSQPCPAGSAAADSGHRQPGPPQPEKVAAAPAPEKKKKTGRILCQEVALRARQKQFGGSSIHRVVQGVAGTGDARLPFVDACLAVAHPMEGLLGYAYERRTVMRSTTKNWAGRVSGYLLIVLLLFFKINSIECTSS